MECKWVIYLLLSTCIVELIDTLWNVNTLATTENYLTMGINRYIMECKLPKDMVFKSNNE